jgi:2,5-furandicarboxylate decarboxylase 1
MAAFAADHFLKYVVVVDDDIDVASDNDVQWAVTVRSQPDRDLLLVDNARGIRMDPSAYRVPGTTPQQVLTSKLGVDATKPVGGESFPERADVPPAGYEELDLSTYLPLSVMERLTTEQERLTRRIH